MIALALDVLNAAVAYIVRLALDWIVIHVVSVCCGDGIPFTCETEIADDNVDSHLCPPLRMLWKTSTNPFRLKELANSSKFP